MSRIHKGLTVFVSGLLAIISLNAQADVVVTQEPQEKVVSTTVESSPSGAAVTKIVETTTRHEVVTPVPAAKETIATPQGFVDCFTVEAAWFRDVWVPTHRVCQYENSGQGAVWIEGYWGCNKATVDGVCTNWDWKKGHWEKTVMVY